MNTRQLTGICLGVAFITSVSLAVWVRRQSSALATFPKQDPRRVVLCEPRASSVAMVAEPEVINNTDTHADSPGPNHREMMTPAARTTCAVISDCATKSVNSILYRAMKSIGERLTLKANLLDIASRSTDATTVVMPRDTWFEELGHCVQSDHNIVGVSVKCPLTLRVPDGDDYHSVLLNAFVEYDIRLGTTQPQSASTDTIQNIHGDTVRTSFESILMKHQCDSVNYRVNCNIVCELCETESLAELIGLPLTDVVVSQVASRLLMPKQWTFDTERELCQFVYAQCITEKEKLSNTLTVDRVLLMFSGEDADTSELCDGTAAFFDQPLSAILCHWVDSVSDIIQNNIQQLTHVQSGRCVWNNSSCALLVPQKDAIGVNKQLHLIGHNSNTPIHTFIVQVQNRAIVATVPRLTHVTMIEVV